MDKRVSAEETRTWAEEHLRRRPELGFGKAIASLVFEPRNPFDARFRRKPKRGFVLAASLFAVAVGWFAYFNFLR